MSVGRICVRTVILASPDESVADAPDLLIEEVDSIGRILRRQAPAG